MRSGGAAVERRGSGGAEAHCHRIPTQPVHHGLLVLGALDDASTSSSSALAAG